MPSPPPMKILGDALMTASPTEPMEQTVSVRKRSGQGVMNPNQRRRSAWRP